MPLQTDSELNIYAWFGKNTLGLRDQTVLSGFIFPDE